MLKDDQLVIITGMSGAGKTRAMQTFEDLGYFCVDNLPPTLIYKFTELLRTSSEINKVALVVDLRAPGSSQEVVNSLITIAKNNNPKENVIFLDASDEKLVSRYEESRRDHPLARNGRVIDGIEKERKLMSQVKDNANIVINTTDLSPKQLQNKIINRFEKNGSEKFHVELMSFGFKYGLPIDADMSFDVRFLSNPYYISELRNQTGLDKPVYDYVMEQSEADEYFEKVFDLLKFVLPKIKSSAKAGETIAIGCTGGQHRSVAMTERLVAALKKLGFTVNVTHRDINRHKGVH
ncbi:RNase adaptor protein RapZ [Fructilactobacillus lindneri]|uniref:RNase adaptor protein RapZ n=1 Tax=Fructilactobacillus lindneri TaxID=53444 RepID=A0AB33BJ30_9LACO|nr:RNase adapter RapZ [Fructilactobacillus lindneri]ANZ58453.1 RNase adaptor protein RapZ [Fructilactobacillus lindneri]ANZ59763.1 RNase adaptor protein RapZ [Fructilactobacillus lindneri]POG98443.1 RNase adaptor protein RapZ [Fructilactobacillus lindneri]POH03842.1 RNase adaptor protein RapZ [Fructilactobacillus lindneri]POH04914.1 RNase adaptor protein RapZ [Fructilactobacillus lindneri]